MTIKHDNPSPAHEASARPKVLRRPQQFSRKAAPAEIDLAAAPLTAQPAEPPLPARNPGRRATDINVPTRREEPHWQEDSRFGMALIFGVVFVNLVLALLLPLMHKPQIIRVPATTLLSGSASMPSPTKDTGESGVKVYRETNDYERARMDLNALPDDYNDFSTDPNDMPAPTARSMEQ